jgi:hypothetical protein
MNGGISRNEPLQPPGLFESTAPSDAKPALDQQGESYELPSWSPGNGSVANTVIAVLLVFYTLYFAAPLLVPIAAAVLLSMLLAPGVQLLERSRRTFPFICSTSH